MTYKSNSSAPQNPITGQAPSNAKTMPMESIMNAIVAMRSLKPNGFKLVRVEDGVEEDAMCRTVDVSFRVTHLEIICCLKFRCLPLNPTVSPLGLNPARS